MTHPRAMRNGTTAEVRACRWREGRRGAMRSCRENPFARGHIGCRRDRSGGKRLWPRRCSIRSAPLVDEYAKLKGCSTTRPQRTKTSQPDKRNGPRNGRITR
eukprot:365181-Chlamydomonas_euryale.AAC.2